MNEYSATFPHVCKWYWNCNEDERNITYRCIAISVSIGVFFFICRTFHMLCGTGVQTCDIFTLFFFRFSEIFYLPFHCINTVGDRQLLLFFLHKNYTLFTASEILPSLHLERSWEKKKTLFQLFAQALTNKRRIRHQTHTQCISSFTQLNT